MVLMIDDKIGHHLDMYADGIKRYLLANGLKRIARAHRCLSLDAINGLSIASNGHSD